MSEKDIKKILEDNDKSSTYTVREINSSSSGKKYEVTKSDNSGDGVLILGILILILYVIAAPYFIYKFIKRKRREAKGNFGDDSPSKKVSCVEDEEIKPIIKTVDLSDENNLDEELYLKAKELVNKQEFIDISKLVNCFDISCEEAEDIIKRLQDDELISLEEEEDHGYVVYKEDACILPGMNPCLVFTREDREGACGPIYHPAFDDYIFALMNIETYKRKYYYIYDSKITDYPKEIVCEYIKKYYEIRLFEDEGIATCISSNSDLAKQMLNLIPDEKLELDDGVYLIYRIGKVKNN